MTETGDEKRSILGVIRGLPDFVLGSFAFSIILLDAQIIVLALCSSFFAVNYLNSLGLMMAVEGGLIGVISGLAITINPQASTIAAIPRAPYRWTEAVSVSGDRLNALRLRQQEIWIRMAVIFSMVFILGLVLS